MFATNGQNFSEWMFKYSTPKIYKQTYLNRTVLGKSPNDDYAGANFGCTALNGKDYGSASASTDDPQVAWHGRMVVAVKSATNLASGSSSCMYNLKYGNVYASMIKGWVRFFVYNSSGTYYLRGSYLPNTQTGETLVTLAQVDVGGNSWYDLEYYLFNDKVFFYCDGVYKGEASVSDPVQKAVASEGMISINSVVGADWVLDYISLVRHEVSTSTGLDRMMVDYVPANGELYLIKKADLATMLLAGTATEVGVAGGVIGSEAVSDGDYLLVQMADDNISGCSVKVVKSGGVWAKSNWSIT